MAGKTEPNLDLASLSDAELRRELSRRRHEALQSEVWSRSGVVFIGRGPGRLEVEYGGSKEILKAKGELSLEPQRTTTDPRSLQSSDGWAVTDVVAVRVVNLGKRKASFELDANGLKTRVASPVTVHLLSPSGEAFALGLRAQVTLKAGESCTVNVSAIAPTSLLAAASADEGSKGGR